MNRSNGDLKMNTTEDEPVEMDPAEVGQNLFYGIGVKKSYRKAFPLLLQAAHAGHIHCMNVVGYCYDLGLGVPKDRSSALSWYERAAEGGHRVALCNLAIIYDMGQGVPPDKAKAVALYHRAAALDNVKYLHRTRMKAGILPC